jgi:hypothetical protein
MQGSLVVLTEMQLRAIVRDEVEGALEAHAGHAEALLDRQQLAQALGVSVPTVDRLRRKGLPTVWVVDVPRFELRALLDWLAQLKRPRLRAVGG